MSSDTEIVNMAMRLLKADRITALGDGTKNANVADDVFTEVRDDMLRAHYWNFATLTVKLAKSSTTPVIEFDNFYPFPADWIRTIGVFDNDAGSFVTRYREEKLEGQHGLLNSADELWLRYVHRETDPNSMNADFRTAFSFALAVAMPGISNLSAVREDKLEGRAEKRLRRAKHSDATGSSPARRPPGSWVTSRAGWPPWRVWPGGPT